MAVSRLLEAVVLSGASRAPPSAVRESVSRRWSGVAEEEHARSVNICLRPDFPKIVITRGGLSGDVVPAPCQSTGALRPTDGERTFTNALALPTEIRTPVEHVANIDGTQGVSLIRPIADVLRRT